MKKLYKAVTTSIFTAGFLALVPPLSTAYAQDSASGDNDLMLEEVNVTARRKEENLQDVPASVQAFGSEMLDAFQINDLAGITARVPGMVYSQPLITEPEIFMRGIGSDIQSAAADSPIGIFLNGVYMSRGAGTIIDLYDLERVEVIKGPQSLRYGKNVVGGLINYVTKGPTDTFEGSLEGTVGDYSRTDIAGSARGPLADNIGYAISGVYRSHGPYGINTLGGGEEGADRTSLRGELVFDTSEQLQITVAGDYTHLEAGSLWLDPAVTGDSYAVTYNSFFAPPIDGLPGFVLPNRNEPFTNGNPRKGPKNFNGFNDADMWDLNLQFDYTTDSGFNFVSTTDYRDTQIEALDESCGMYWDFPFTQAAGGLMIPDINSIYSEDVYTYLDRVPDCWFQQNKTDDVSQFSQEFRFSGGTAGDLTWSTGLYYLDEDISRTEYTGFMFPDFSVITEYAFSMAYGGQPTGEDMTQGVSVAETSSKSKNYGVFGEVTWWFSDDWSLNAGLRYAKDKKNFTVTRSGDSFDQPIAGGGFTTKESNSWDAWLPSLVLTWDIADGINSYASYTAGYKPGGYSGEGAGNPEDALVSFDPEFSDNFEVGMKSTLAGGRARLNGAVFYTDYTDLQTNQFIQVDPMRPPDNFVVNAKDGTIAYGLELDFEAMLTRNLSMFANYAYTKCEFSGELIIDDEGTDIDGNTCRRTPKNGINIGANWSKPISDNLELLLGINYMWSSDYYFDNENSDILKVPSQDNIDLRAGLGSTNGTWDVTAWMKNASNNDNIVNTFELFGTVYNNYAPPKTYGVTFRYNFF
jgi:iron complex outermembrane receptor protein